MVGRIKPDRRDVLSDRSECNETLTASFERVVAKHSLSTALITDGWQPTYKELNATANRLAHAIVSRGGSPNDRVALLLHDAAAIAALLAVLKAGRIVVALTPSHPPARLHKLVEHSQPSLIITESCLRNSAAEIAGADCQVIGFEENSTDGVDHNPSMLIAPQQTAILGYTSGSTGRPKGVMVTHRQVQRSILNHTEAMAYCAEDHIPLFSSLSTGQGMTMTWCALLNGAALCPFPVVTKGVTGLAEWMARRGITVYSSSSSIFRNFMKTVGADFRFPNVRAVRLSSESRHRRTSNCFMLISRTTVGSCTRCLPQKRPLLPGRADCEENRFQRAGFRSERYAGSMTLS